MDADEIRQHFTAKHPVMYWVPEPVVKTLTEQILIAVTQLTDSKGLRVVAPQDISGAYVAAHAAISAATGALINPVLPEGWVHISGFGAEASI